jgi:signal transduction histidine kinase
MVRDLKVRSRRPVQSTVAVLFVFLFAIFLSERVALGEIVNRSPRVLILYPYDERIPATAIAGEAARNRLLEATSGKIDLFSEFLDLGRFPEDAHIDRMARYLAQKYADRRPDVVIAISDESASFIVANRNAIAPDAKIIFCGFGRAVASKMDLPGDVVGAFSEFDIARTIDMARRLQPNASHLFIISGSANFDRTGLAAARADLAVASKDYETTYLTDLTIEEFVERAAHVPADSIVLVLSVGRDRTGRNFIPRQALEQIEATASAPVYGPYDTYIGHGAVGASASTVESVGRTAADLAVDALAGKPIANVDVPQTYVADARQLKRWGLSESALPPGTVLSFKEKTLWEEYWQVILAVVAVVALQGIVIIGLLIERRRRFAAQGESRLRLLELVHMNQSATAGALSASIAHELNQPLGAIRANAEAMEAILQSKTPDMKLIQEILVDIRDDDQRAGDIILRLRGLLKKRSEIDWQEFDLNEVVSSAISILHAEAEKRSVVVSAGKPAQRLPIRADKVHVQQVILNLATNAMDAMLDAGASERKLMFQTMLTEESKVEMSISDTGRGIPSDQLGNVFNAFYTTKPTGTGLGLSIARAIVETYGGKIWADNRAEGGAVFRFVLPLAHRG